MIRSTSLAIFLIAMSPGPAAYGQETGGNRSVVPSPSGAAPGQPLNSDHLAPTGKTLPNPGVPQASGTTEFDRSIQKRDDKLVPLHRGFDGFKVNGGLGGPRARPESQCCARGPGSAL